MWDILDRTRREGALVDIARGVGPDQIGFVAGLSHELVLLSCVCDGDFNGGAIFELRSIEAIRWGSAYLDSRARLAAESPMAPDSAHGIDLGSWSGALVSAGRFEDVLSIHRDYADMDYLAATHVEVRGECVSGDVVTVRGDIDGRFAFELDSVSRLEFGGRYERMLQRLLKRAALA